MGKDKNLYPIKLQNSSEDFLISFIVAPKEVKDEEQKEPEMEKEEVAEEFK